jgi:hypothetical protein
LQGLLHALQACHTSSCTRRVLPTKTSTCCLHLLQQSSSQALLLLLLLLLRTLHHTLRMLPLCWPIPPTHSCSHKHSLQGLMGCLLLLAGSGSCTSTITCCLAALPRRPPGLAHPTSSTTSPICSSTCRRLLLLETIHRTLALGPLRPSSTPVCWPASLTLLLLTPAPLCLTLWAL